MATSRVHDPSHRRRQAAASASSVIPPPPPGLRDVPEAELVQRFRSGGRAGDDAYSELVERHQAWMVRLVGYLLGGFADAEDVAQEAFVRGFLHRDDLSDNHGFKPWVRVIATRVAFNTRRASAARKRYHGQVQAPATNDMPDASPEARQLLEQVLGKLPYAFREVLVLRYVEELSIAEIATQLNLGESAAKMRLARARDEFNAVQAREG